MSEVEDFENEGAPALVPEESKKVVTSELELELVEAGKVVGDYAPDPDPEPDLLPVRIDLTRLGFRAAMKNSQSVRYLQDLLVEAGCPVGSDPRGWLADGTRKALITFQGRAGLPVTGLADVGTVEALFAVSREYVWDR